MDDAGIVEREIVRWTGAVIGSGGAVIGTTGAVIARGSAVVIARYRALWNRSRFNLGTDEISQTAPLAARIVVSA
jgi:hypothetical protein